jgi:hypothetical protein
VKEREGSVDWAVGRCRDDGDGDGYRKQGQVREKNGMDGRETTVGIGLCKCERAQVQSLLV